MLAGTPLSCTQCSFVLPFYPAYSMWLRYPSMRAPGSLHTTFPAFTWRCAGLQTNYAVNLWHNITDISKDERLIKSSSLTYKSHLEITLKYHIQVCKEKVNVIFDEFWIHSTAKSQDTSPGLNFLKNSLHGQTGSLCSFLSCQAPGKLEGRQEDTSQHLWSCWNPMVSCWMWHQPRSSLVMNKDVKKDHRN